MQKLRRLRPTMSDIIPITGAAGFIGYHLSECLLKKGYSVVGLDNVNEYYDVSLKHKRLSNLQEYEKFTFIRGDLSDRALIDDLFHTYSPKIVINLAAQAGVRYSIEHPEEYVKSNIVGFFNILEACRNNPVDHLIFASSSSVYGNQTKVPFAESDCTDCPVSFYAATKKSNEAMAYAYSCIFGIPSTGLRFFTVYGPLGRPDMAYFKFTNNIRDGKPINVYNNGDMRRDFTYVDDIVNAIEKMLYHPPKENENGVKFKIYNIGRGKSETLLDFIGYLEKSYGKKANINLMPMQPGDVYQTYSDTSELYKDFGYSPRISLEEGIDRFIRWYKEYYSIE